MASTGREAQRRDPSPSRRGEDDKERVDRELIELLNELRVALPGVQVLFAFLLILPFTQGWTRLSGFERDVYVASLLFAAAATGLLIAPTSYHRIRFREGDKERMLVTSNRMSIAGLALLALSMAAAVFVIASFVLGEAAGWAIAGGTAAWFAWFWYGVPIGRRVRDPD